MAHIDMTGYASFKGLIKASDANQIAENIEYLRLNLVREQIQCIFSANFDGNKVFSGSTYAEWANDIYIPFFPKNDDCFLFGYFTETFATTYGWYIDLFDESQNYLTTFNFLAEGTRSTPFSSLIDMFNFNYAFDYTKKYYLGIRSSSSGAVLYETGIQIFN